jgi:hypothetical protein
LRLASADGTRVPIAVTTDVRLLAFVVAIAAATTMLFGLCAGDRIGRGRRGPCAARATRARRADGGTDQFGSCSSARSAIARFVLLIGAGLFVGTLANLRHVDLDSRRRVDSSSTSIRSRRLPWRRVFNAGRAAHGAVVECARRECGGGCLRTAHCKAARVRPTACTLTAPIGPNPAIKATFDSRRRTLPGRQRRADCGGRDLSRATDRAGSELVVVINESLARALFGAQPAIGRRMLWDNAVARDRRRRQGRELQRSSGTGGGAFLSALPAARDRAELASARFIVSGGRGALVDGQGIGASVTSEEPRFVHSGD